MISETATRRVIEEAWCQILEFGTEEKPSRIKGFFLRPQILTSNSGSPVTFR
jgi:hypothetical protein